jgi:hypothetical protein
MNVAKTIVVAETFSAKIVSASTVDMAMTYGKEP